MKKRAYSVTVKAEAMFSSNIHTLLVTTRFKNANTSESYVDLYGKLHWKKSIYSMSPDYVY